MLTDLNSIIRHRKYILAIRSMCGNIKGYFVDYDTLPSVSIKETKEYANLDFIKEKRLEILKNWQFLLDNEKLDILVI